MRKRSQTAHQFLHERGKSTHDLQAILQGLKEAHKDVSQGLKTVETVCHLSSIFHQANGYWKKYPEELQKGATQKSFQEVSQYLQQDIPQRYFQEGSSLSEQLSTDSKESTTIITEKKSASSSTLLLLRCISL